MRMMQPARSQARAAAFTLVEILVATAIAVLVMAGMFQGYNIAARQAQFSSFSLAANAMAMQQLESIRAANWVVTGTSVTDIFSPVLTIPQTNALCVPNSGTNLVYGTNYATVTQLSTNPPYLMIKVSCMWNFIGMGNFTNTLVVLRGPDI